MSTLVDELVLTPLAALEAEAVYVMREVAAVDDPPEVARELEATVCWMVEEPALAGQRYLLKHTTRRVRATLEEVVARVDVETLETDDAGELRLNDIGRVRLRTSAPVLADPYAQNRATGAFILIDERTHDTVAAGMVETARPGPAPEPGRSRDVRWHPSAPAAGPRWASRARRCG